jgi:anti-sigma B factor antagonist
VRFTTRSLGRILLVELKRPIVNEPDAPLLHERVKMLLEEGHRRFLVDMEKCRYATSAGIGIVVACRTSILAVGGVLKLCNVSHRARTSFVVAGVWGLFDVYGSREEALAEFSTEPAEDPAPASEHV